MSADASKSAADASFAQGMHAALWPKVAQCHEHVAVLLAAQQQLQETVDQLVAGLKEAQQADANSSLVGYADRLRAFPVRIARLQQKLTAIEDRLLAMKEARNRGASCVAKLSPEEAMLF